METKEKRRFCGSIAEVTVSSIGNYYLGNLPYSFWKKFDEMFPNWKKDPNVLQNHDIPVFNCKSKLYDFCDSINKAYNTINIIAGVKLIESDVHFLNVKGYIVSDGTYYWFTPKNISNTDFWVQFYQKVPEWYTYATNYNKKLEIRFKDLSKLHKFISDINLDYSDTIGGIMNGNFSSILMPEIDCSLKKEELPSEFDRDLIIKIKKHHVNIFN